MENLSSVEAFGVHLKALRKARSWSQQALADYADVAKLTVQRIKHVEGSFTLDVVVSLARALCLPLREMLSFPDADVAA